MRPPTHLGQRKPDVMAAELSGLRIGLLTALGTRLGGGVGEAVVRQAELIRSCGGEAQVFALEDQFSAEDTARFAGSTVQWSKVRGPAQIGFAPDLSARLRAAELDCLHLHGIWMYPSRAAAVWARATRRPLIISTHGMLDPTTLARGRWKKWLARHGYEYVNWSQARSFHALSQAEAANIRNAAGPVPCMIIPNAAPDRPGPRPTKPRQPGMILFLGRIHAVKNLAGLLAGWQRARLPVNAHLLIAGWGEPGDVAQLEQGVAAAGGSVSYIGPVYGARKQELLERAQFVVLPSLSEGLPVTVLEAWAAGTPTILSRESNLPEGFEAGAAIESGLSAEPIAAALERALGLNDPQWLAMSAAAQRLAAGRFSAATVAQTWADAYRALIDNSPQPGTGLASAHNSTQFQGSSAP